MVISICFVSCFGGRPLQSSVHPYVERLSILIKDGLYIVKVIFSAFYAKKITLSVIEQNINFVRTFRRFTCNALHIGRGDISISTKTNIFVIISE